MCENRLERVIRVYFETTGIVMAILISAFLQIEKEIIDTEQYILYLWGLPCIFISFIFSFISFIAYTLYHSREESSSWEERARIFFLISIVFFVLSIILLFVVLYIQRLVMFSQNV